MFMYRQRLFTVYVKVEIVYCLCKGRDCLMFRYIQILFNVYVLVKSVNMQVEKVRIDAGQLQEEKEDIQTTLEMLVDPQILGSLKEIDRLGCTYNIHAYSVQRTTVYTVLFCLVCLSTCLQISCFHIYLEISDIINKLAKLKKNH